MVLYVGISVSMRRFSVVCSFLVGVILDLSNKMLVVSLCGLGIGTLGLMNISSVSSSCIFHLYFY